MRPEVNKHGKNTLHNKAGAEIQTPNLKIEAHELNTNFYAATQRFHQPKSEAPLHKLEFKQT